MGKPDVRYLRGAAGNVYYGGTANPPATERAGPDKPPPTVARASALPDHIEMETDQLEASESFMIVLGMRPIFKTNEIAILELRAATHLVLVAKHDIEPATHRSI